MVTQLTQNKKGALKLDSDNYVDATRSRIILLNLLLIRIMLFKILLSPWHLGITDKPINRGTRKVIKNLRILATVFYRYLREILSNLPLIVKSSSKASTQAGNATDTDGGQVEDLLHERKHSSSSQIKSQFMKNFLTVVGFADETPGFEEFQAGSIELFLLEPRDSSFESLDMFHKLLYSDKEIEPVIPFVEEWKIELLPILSTWCENVVKNIILEKMKREEEAQKQLSARV
jgi:hypothetical protein